MPIYELEDVGSLPSRERSWVPSLEHRQGARSEIPCGSWSSSTAYTLSSHGSRSPQSFRLSRRARLLNTSELRGKPTAGSEAKSQSLKTLSSPSTSTTSSTSDGTPTHAQATDAPATRAGEDPSAGSRQQAPSEGQTPTEASATDPRSTTLVRRLHGHRTRQDRAGDRSPRTTSRGWARRRGQPTAPLQAMPRGKDGAREKAEARGGAREIFDRPFLLTPSEPFEMFFS